MKRLRFACAVAAGLTACEPSDGPAPTVVTSVRVDLAAEILGAHNVERSAVRLAPLAWDARLAANATTHANALARAGTMRHSSPRALAGQGENLWMGTRGAFTPRQMVQSWASEKARFRAGAFPNVSRTGNWADVGHYTQMIWPTTTRVGCGIGQSARFDFLVCRYSPAGNITGQRVP